MVKVLRAAASRSAKVRRGACSGTIWDGAWSSSMAAGGLLQGADGEVSGGGGERAWCRGWEPWRRALGGRPRGRGAGWY